MKYNSKNLVALIALIVAGSIGAPAGAAVVAKQSFPAVLAAHPMPLDATLADPLWASGQIVNAASGFENLTTRSTASLPTTVSVLYDSTNLYVAFHAEQSGVPITTTQSANDVGFGVDDFVGVGIDTSDNGSQVYFFETTPRGVRYQQASENARYRPDWRAAGKIDGNTWNAVMVIPLKALRIGPGSVHTWRLNFVRSVAALGEHYTWAYDGTMMDNPIPFWPAQGDARFWPSLSALKFASASNAVRAKPRAEVYGLSSSGLDRSLFEQSNGTFLPETVRNAGIDMTYPLTNTINFVATGNPDFSNVEIDQQTIAPQEFRRSLQEYRPFFAQGAQFLNPSSATIGGITTPPNLLFYSPSVGPFDRGEKVEGAFGKQSFGVLNFRGYDQSTGNEFDDTAYGYKHGLSDRTFDYWADGVLAHHSLFGSDNANEIGAGGRNLKSGFVWAVDHAVETGSWVPAPGVAHSSNGFVDVHKPNYELNVDYENVTPNFNPIDGFTLNSDIRGPNAFVTFSGATPGTKNWNVFFSGDRFVDRSGAVHQADTLLALNVTLKNGFSITNLGPTVGILRSYASADPAAFPQGCNDPNLPRGYFTGYPDYRCGRDDRYNFFNVGIGYRDGSPAPIDVTLSEGPFGGNFQHAYSVVTSRPLGSLYSIALEYDGNYQRSLDSGILDSQWLRRVTIGRTIGSDSNLSVSLRSISGNGGFAIPGLNVTAAYHRHYANGNDLFVNFGTPSAVSTLDRLIVKYVLRFGGGAGT